MGEGERGGGVASTTSLCLGSLEGGQRLLSGVTLYICHSRWVSLCLDIGRASRSLELRPYSAFEVSEVLLHVAL